MLSWSCRDLLVQLWRSYLCFSFSRTELVLSSERFVPSDARSEGRSKLTTESPLQAPKSTQLFIRTHNEAFSVVAMRIGNPDCSPMRIATTENASLCVRMKS